MSRGLKGPLSGALASVLRATRGLRKNLTRLYAHAGLAADVAGGRRRRW